MQHKTLGRLAGFAVLLVASIAATVSYLHIYRLAVQLGQPQLAAWLMPLSVDGAVGAASVALLSAARSDQRSPWAARVMLALGVAATLAANGYSGSAHGIAGVALAMWPGVAFVGSAETALSMVRRLAKVATAESASMLAVEMLTAPAHPPLSLAFPRVSDSPVTIPAIQSATEPASIPRGKRTARSARPVSRDRRAAAIVARTPDISGAELGRKLGVSERTGRRMLSEMSAA